MPRLTLLLKDHNAQPFKIPLERELTCIGRDAENDIIIDSSSVSSFHCVMKRVLGGFILQDLDSTNGLEIAGSLHKMIELEDGMRVKIGDATLQVRFPEDEILDLREETLATALEHKPSAASALKPPPVPHSKSLPSNTLYLLLVLLALAAGVGLRIFTESPAL